MILHLRECALSYSELSRSKHVFFFFDEPNQIQSASFFRQILLCTNAWHDAKYPPDLVPNSFSDQVASPSM